MVVIFYRAVVEGIRGFFGRNHHNSNDEMASFKGAAPSSEVERSLMVRWVVGSILH